MIPGYNMRINMKRILLVLVTLLMAVSAFGATKTVLIEDFDATW